MLQRILILITCLIGWAALTAPGQANMVSPVTTGYIDKNGKVVLQVPQDGPFRAPGRFTEGLAPVYVGSQLGYVDRQLKLVIPAEFDEAHNFCEGLARVKVGLKWGFIDKTGKVVIPVDFSYAGDFSEGLAAVKVEGKWGYIDLSGKVVIPLQYQQAESFAQGLARVKEKLVPVKGVTPPGLNAPTYFFINQEGKAVLSKYAWVDDQFSEGLARVGYYKL